MRQSVSVSEASAGDKDPAQPGWYPDPWRIAPYRWWDGSCWTGSVSQPIGVDSETTLANQDEFGGGMNVPSTLGGRLNATVPLALLTIGENTLQIRPRLFGRAMFSDFEVRLDQITAAFRLKGTFMTSGVGFELSDGQVGYFWTFRDQARLLSALRQRGVPIDPVPRRATGALSGQFGLLSKWGRSTLFGGKTPGVFPADERADALLHACRNRRHRSLASMGTPFG